MEQAIGTDEWLRMVGSLLLVLTLVVASLWAWRWVQRRGLGGPRSQQVKIEEVLPMGVRHKIVLLRAGQRQVLVGVSPNGMTALAQWSDFEAAVRGAQAAAAQAPMPGQPLDLAEAPIGTKDQA